MRTHWQLLTLRMAPGDRGAHLIDDAATVVGESVTGRGLGESVSRCRALSSGIERLNVTLSRLSMSILTAS